MPALPNERPCFAPYVRIQTVWTSPDLSRSPWRSGRGTVPAAGRDEPSAASTGGMVRNACRPLRRMAGMGSSTLLTVSEPCAPTLRYVPARRVALCPSSYGPNLGGVEQLSARLAASLTASGCHVGVVTSQWPRDTAGERDDRRCSRAARELRRARAAGCGAPAVCRAFPSLSVENRRHRSSPRGRCRPRAMRQHQRALRAARRSAAPAPAGRHAPG